MQTNKPPPLPDPAPSLRVSDKITLQMDQSGALVIRHSSLAEGVEMPARKLEAWLLRQLRAEVLL